MKRNLFSSIAGFIRLVVLLVVTCETFIADRIRLHCACTMPISMVSHSDGVHTMEGTSKGLRVHTQASKTRKGVGSTVGCLPRVISESGKRNELGILVLLPNFGPTVTPSELDRYVRPASKTKTKSYR